MSTLRQIEANRRNALKSTGPTSVTGKAASSMNALKTGLHAKSLVLPSEKLADLEELIEDYYQHHRPASPDARGLVDDLIRCEWTLRRLDNAETQAWQYQAKNTYDEPEKFPLGKSITSYSNTFSKFQYRLDATRRARLRALQALEKLKSEPARPQSLSPSPGATKIGFVPPTVVPARLQPAPAAPNPDEHLESPPNSASHISLGNTSSPAER